MTWMEMKKNAPYLTITAVKNNDVNLPGSKCSPRVSSVVVWVALSPALVRWVRAWPWAARGWKAPRHLWFPLRVERQPLISCFSIQEMGGEKEGYWSERPSEGQREKEGGRGMKEDKWRDGGKARWKEGEDGWKSWMSMRAPGFCECVCLCFLSFLLIELVLLGVQYSSFRLMVELIFLTLLCVSVL